MRNQNRSRRGTRPLHGVVDCHDNADDRLAAIANSDKPQLEVLDFVGNAGRLKLISIADILGGNYSDDVVELATEKAQKCADPVDMAEMLRACEV